MKKSHLLLFVFAICFCTRQFKYPPNKLNTHYVGFLFSADLAQNQKDNLFNAYPERKLSIGITFTNKKNDFIFYLGGGFKGWKVSAHSPQFSSAFTNEIIQSYHPVTGNLHDSLAAVSVYNMAQKKKDFYMFGFYAQYIDAGFILTQYRLRPSISFYSGWEDFVLFTPDAHFLDLNNESYSEWISMQANFKEIKLGLDLLGIFNHHNLPFTLDANVGYKWINYKNIAFENTSLSVYTNDQITEKYNTAKKLTFGINFRYWTNWQP